MAVIQSGKQAFIIILVETWIGTGSGLNSSDKGTLFCWGFGLQYIWHTQRIALNFFYV